MNKSMWNAGYWQLWDGGQETLARISGSSQIVPTSGSIHDWIGTMPHFDRDPETGEVNPEQKIVLSKYRARLTVGYIMLKLIDIAETADNVTELRPSVILAWDKFYAFMATGIEQAPLGIVRSRNLYHQAAAQYGTNLYERLL